MVWVAWHPGRGRKLSLSEGTVAEVVALTMNELPDDGSTQWSTRSMAKHVGTSHDTVAHPGGPRSETLEGRLL
jgi:hypothetical protein